MRDLFDSVLAFFHAILDFFHTILEPVFGVHSWGWSIIALTLLVRIFLLPLAIKQTRSMRAMQAIQPQIKELQKKYKVDRELLKKDPETYRARRQKMSEEQMALFKREGANPAASCLPLLAQAPIFIALFWTLQRSEELPGEPFYFFTRYVPTDGLTGVVADAGWPGWLLIVLMSGSMFITQRQMLARSAAMGTENPMAQQQKILMYVMPIFLAVISFRFPLGILLYWVTTNIWQIVQQWYILREVQHEVATGEIADKPGGQAAKRNKPPKGGEPRRSPGASSGQKKGDAGNGEVEGGKGKGAKGSKGDGAKADGADQDATGKTAMGKNDGSAKGRSGKGSSSDKDLKGGKGGKAGAGKGDAGSGTVTNGSGPGEGSEGSGNGSSGSGRADRPGKRDHLPRRGGGSRS